MIIIKTNTIWHLYLIRTHSGALYTGITTDVARRVSEHNAQGEKSAKSLRGKGPFTLVFQKKIGDKSSALKLEHQIKQLSKQQKELFIMSKHQTLDKHVKLNIAWVKTIPAVTKIVIGISEACRHKYSPGHIRFKLDVDGGIKINAYSGKGVTDLFIKIDPIIERDKVKIIIENRFSRKLDKKLDKKA